MIFNSNKYISKYYLAWIDYKLYKKHMYYSISFWIDIPLNLSNTTIRFLSFKINNYYPIKNRIKNNFLKYQDMIFLNLSVKYD